MAYQNNPFGADPAGKTGFGGFSDPRRRKVPPYGMANRGAGFGVGGVPPPFRQPSMPFRPPPEREPVERFGQPLPPTLGTDTATGLRTPAPMPVESQISYAPAPTGQSGAGLQPAVPAYATGLPMGGGGYTDQAMTAMQTGGFDNMRLQDLLKRQHPGFDWTRFQQPQGLMSGMQPAAAPPANLDFLKALGGFGR
jgi:hypothetical protein